MSKNYFAANSVKVTKYHLNDFSFIASSNTLFVDPSDLSKKLFSLALSYFARHVTQKTPLKFLCKINAQ